MSRVRHRVLRRRVRCVLLLVMESMSCAAFFVWRVRSRLKARKPQSPLSLSLVVCVERESSMDKILYHTVQLRYMCISVYDFTERYPMFECTKSVVERSVKERKWKYSFDTPPSKLQWGHSAKMLVAPFCPPLVYR